jgi:hypothetical protein
MARKQWAKAVTFREAHHAALEQEEPEALGEYVSVNFFMKVAR